MPLTDEDERSLELFRATTTYRQALADLSGEDFETGEASEAALLHAVLVAGQNAIMNAAEEAGYAVIAAEQADMESVRAEARRRRPSWADET